MALWAAAFAWLVAGELARQEPDMNHESNDFARWIWTQRTGTDKATAAYAVEHYKPQHEHRIWPALRIVICLAACVAIGWLAAKGV